jgi:hypothetical protein
MTSTDFLDHVLYGYSELNPAERDAIHDFMLIWSFTEYRVFKKHASKHVIKEEIQGLQARGRLEHVWYRPNLDYFRNRYFAGSVATVHFPKLYLEKSKMRAEVEAVLTSNVNDVVSELTALLCIIYRLRNNLLHGEKWEYGLHDQLGNFSNATAVLIGLVEAAD